jgi:hypothetical protein
LEEERSDRGQPSPYGYVQGGTIDTLEGTAEHSIAFKQGKGEITLLHAARIIGDIHLS